MVWLSENPIIPTPEQEKELENWVEKTGNMDRIGYVNFGAIVTEWQRRMFLAPEPIEDYADKILKNASPGYTPTHAELDKIWNHIFRAGHGWVPPSMREEGKNE